jgi:hypothetical protein
VDTDARVSGATNNEAGGLTALSLAKVQRASRTMRQLQALDETNVARWVGYWKTKGLFDGTA